MIPIFMGDMTALGIFGYNDERNASSISEEVDGLDVARVVVSAALIEGDEDGGVVPERRVRLDLVDDLLDEAFEEIEFG